MSTSRSSELRKRRWRRMEESRTSGRSDLEPLFNRKVREREIPPRTVEHRDSRGRPITLPEVSILKEKA